MQNEYDFFSEKVHDCNFSEYESALGVRPSELKNQKILNIGGGCSPIVWDIQRNYGLKNFHITNVEPFMGDESLGRNQHKLIQESFLDCDFQKEFNKVWALWSLPYYAKTPGDIVLTFTKSILALQDSGEFRIGPADIVIREDSFTSDYRLRLEVLSKFVAFFNNEFPRNKIETIDASSQRRKFSSYYTKANYYYFRAPDDKTDVDYWCRTMNEHSIHNFKSFYDRNLRFL
ncbi:MAG: hypothetical protein LBJ18_03015 [Rickettsiales bacterium]|jgi:hypothetical protein|nr:hypothetical protein [Rickettsiales bacterium]